MRNHSEDTLCDKAYAFVSRMLMRGELSPGAKLSERALSSACGVSRVPMREAIRRLVEEGALFQKSQSGTYVATITRKDLVEIYEVREAIECRQTRTAVACMTEADRRAFADRAARQRRIADAFTASGAPLLQGRAEQDFLAHDFAQHLMLLRKAGNAYAEKIVTTAYRRNRFFGLHSHRRDASHVLRTCDDHELLARAVAAGNAEAAEAAMREHIRHSLSDALAQFDRA